MVGINDILPIIALIVSAVVLLQARSQAEFTIAKFETVWTTLLGHPDQPVTNYGLTI